MMVRFDQQLGTFLDHPPAKKEVDNIIIMKEIIQTKQYIKKKHYATIYICVQF